MKRLETGMALLTALVACAALGLQLQLVLSSMTANGATVLFAVWRFFGFFTILANCAVVLISAALVFRPGGRFATPRGRLMATTAIVLVGLVYSVALRSTWQPTGWQAVADHLLHDVTPILFLATWLVGSHGDLNRKDVAWVAVPPLLYFAYALTRGSLDGWYAYWFLDPAEMALVALAGSVLLLSGAFLAVGALLVLADWGLAGWRRPDVPAR